MRPGQTLLYLFAKDAGLSLQLETFDDRFKLQKKTYVAQLAGLDMRYRFSWYLKGPYSRELTADAFALKDVLDGQPKPAGKYVLSSDAKRCFKIAERIWAVPSNLQVSESDWLEALVSLHYLKHLAYWQPKESRSKQAILERLLVSKPRFKGQQRTLGAAWVRLKEFGLTTSKTI